MVHPALTAVRATQLGLWTRAQARGAGLAYSTVRAWVRDGRAIELFPGVFADAALPVTWEHRAVAARCWLGGDAVLSHHSAAEVLRLRLPTSQRDQPIHLTVACRTPSTPSGIRVHRTRGPFTDHVAACAPHRVTAAAWTLCDLAGVFGPSGLRRTVAHAVRVGLTTAAETRAVLQVRGAIAGAPALRRILDELSPLEHRTRSELESLYLRVTARFGLEPDVMNHPVRDVHGTRRHLDAAYLPEHVPVELDSRQEHGTLLDWHDDTRREQDIQLAGPWRTFLRFSWDDLAHHADAVASRIRTALRAAGTSRQL